MRLRPFRIEEYYARRDADRPGDLRPPRRALRERGVLLIPGSVYDEPAHVRVGYGRANLPEALVRLEQLLSG
jgi:aspartate/methionine/tyrosine aminotransferase